MSQSALPQSDLSKRDTIPMPSVRPDAPSPALEAELQATLQPNLTRDLAGLMTLLFIFITYHIQHPTLLLRSHFGRAFRGDSLQEAVAVALLLSGGLLLWQVWSDTRQDALKGYQIAFGLGLGLYGIHTALMLLQGVYPLLELYGLAWEDLERPFREETYVNPVKALNIMAMLAGAALASVFFLWAPWERARDFPLRTGLSLLSLGAVVALFMAVHPLENMRGGPWSALHDMAAVVGFLSVAAIGGLAAVSLMHEAPAPLRRLQIVLVLVALSYSVYGLLIAVTDINPVFDFYDVQPRVYGEFFSDSAFRDPMLAFDWGSLLAGMAAAAAFFLMMPWERLGLYARVLRENAIPILIAVGAIAGWEWAVDNFEIEEFLLPRPSVIWTEFKDIYPRLIAAGWLTFQNAIFGFLAGCTAGIITGMIAARFTRFSRAILPLAIAANSVPIIAFAPIANLWFGVADIMSKIAIVGVLCYFPAMISTLRGLSAADPKEIDLMRSYAANELQILRKVRIPVALPFILSALKLSTTLAMIGAIVAEFFGGSFSGLGYLIRNDAVLFRFPASWSAILVASLFGISFYVFISALERVLMPWYGSFRSESR